MKKIFLQLSLFFCILFSLCFSDFIYSENHTIVLKLSNLSTWAKSFSPELKLLRLQRDLDNVSGYLNLGLEKKNPELSFSNESIKKDGYIENEKTFALSKTFEMPWIYKKRLKGWNFYQKAQGLYEKSRTKKYIGEMKTGYVDIVIQKKRMYEYNRLKVILKELMLKAKKKENEGFLAPIQLHLIQIAVGNLDIRNLQLRIKLETVENRWKQKMGISPGKELQLITAIDYKPLDMDSEDLLNELLPKTSGYQKWQATELRLLTQISVEKLRFMPDITFSGGYKKVSDGFNGYTFGLSLNLPIMSQNKKMKEKQQLALELHRSQFSWFYKESKRKIQSKHRAILQYSQLLEGIEKPPISPSKEIMPIMAAFEEGTVSINDMLSSIQLYIESMNQYYSVLNNYYASLFQLETLLEKKLVVFN